MFDKIKKIADYTSLGASVGFLGSLMLNSWRIPLFLLFIVVIAVNTATYMEIKKSGTVGKLIEGVTEMFKP